MNNDQPPQIANRSYPMWAPQSQSQPQPQQPPENNNPTGFPNPNRPPLPPLSSSSGRMKWKGKKPIENRKIPLPPPSTSNYIPPALNDLQFQNRVKARRFYPKKKYFRFAPFAPRNTSSFIIRAKKSGGIASLVSPCPVTPAILPTPKFSPTREGLVDMAKEEWGVDGYGSMKGLIRLRSPNGYEIRSAGDEEDDDEDGSSESDVEEHLEVERRLDHDLSRFEMVYPGSEFVPSLENRVDDQDSHIARLQEENLMLKERLFLMEQEMGELRRRVVSLENRYGEREDVRNVGENENENENGNENDGEEGSDNDGGGDMSSEKSTGDCEEKSTGDCEESAGTPMHE